MSSLSYSQVIVLFQFLREVFRQRLCEFDLRRDWKFPAGDYCDLTFIKMEIASLETENSNVLVSSKEGKREKGEKKHIRNKMSDPFPSLKSPNKEYFAFIAEI